MELKEVAKHHIITNAIQQSCVKFENSVTTFNYSVLVLDKVGLRIISSCCNMTDLNNNGITRKIKTLHRHIVEECPLMKFSEDFEEIHTASEEAIKWMNNLVVEDLFRGREPLDLDAVYFLTPTKSSVAALLCDFPLIEKTKYKSAHIYFTHACPDHILKLLLKLLPKRKIVSFKEINIAFIPFERQVFTLNCGRTFQSCFNFLLDSAKNPLLDTLAFEIASVCYVLNEYPSIYYDKRSNNKSALELAQLVMKELRIMKNDKPSMGDNYEKIRSQLIIIDRSFDWISLILHELTFQAMAHDNFLIKNNVFRVTENDAQNEVVFDDKDELWTELKHQHIYNVADILKNKLKNYTHSGYVSANDVSRSTSAAGVSDVIKKIPQQQKTFNNIKRYMGVLEKCMDFYGKHLANICIFEQDLVMGKEATEDKITYDVKKRLTSFLMDNNVSIKNKMRLIILYILFMNGVSEDIFKELVQNAQLPPANIQTIINLNKLGVAIIVDENNKEPPRKTKRKDRVDEDTFQVSRWTPRIKDIIEHCIENKLDPDEFPYAFVREPSTKNKKTSSSRYNTMWYKGKDSKQHNPRIILFINGGITYSEIRSVYEVSKICKNWDIVIGSSHIITPEDVLQNLSNLGVPRVTY